MVDDCQRCGACCFSESSAYVPVTEADRARLADAGAGLVHEEDGAHYMTMIEGRCAALHIRAGAFACSVYDRRPAICRELHRGTPACREERTLKRARAAVLLA
jgi:Fe-S-cluster containining protein